jgi:hypothetical protein
LEVHYKYKNEIIGVRVHYYNKKITGKKVELMVQRVSNQEMLSRLGCSHTLVEVDHFFHEEGNIKNIL